MNSLRNRIAILLVASIIAVVALATLAADRALQPPPPGTALDPLARQLAMITKIAEEAPDTSRKAGFDLRSSPDNGDVDEPMSAFMMQALGGNGEQRRVIVTRQADRPIPIASVQLSSGDWLVTDIPDRGPPPGGWKIFGMWIVLIVVGSVIVSIQAARRIVRPLELLESAASRIGPDGKLLHITETGPGEVRATARALNNLSERLRAAMESRMRLVAAAGHDLRTPMTRMRLRAEFIADEEERAKWLADLEELDAIADSAIRLVREEVDRDPAETLDLDGLTKEIVEEMVDIGHAGAIAYVSAGKRLPVRANPIAIKRALRNLAINAVVHGKKAEIRLVNRGDDVVLTITDEGPGIPEHLIGQVFEPFFRVDPGRRKSVAGAGLGLAIAKEIIERFGGRLTVANRQPSGLVQTVILPGASTPIDR